MFTGPTNKPAGRGRIEVICGPMFSGKTEALICRLKDAQQAGQELAIFKPAIDKRYDDRDIVSHRGNRIRAMPVANSREIPPLAGGAAVVGIDEAQFFDADLTAVVAELAGKGVRVILAGLDMDYTGKPFGPVPALLAQAESVTRLQAICVSCGEPAIFSHRKVKADGQILLGERDEYEPRCRKCFFA